MLKEDQSPPNILNWTLADSKSFAANQIDSDEDLDSHWLTSLILIGYCVVAPLARNSWLIRPECGWQTRTVLTVKLVHSVFAGHFLV